MDEFVNYKKRDISLPPGCKDLLDLVRASNAPPDALYPAEPPLGSEPDAIELSGHLRDLEKYAAMVYESAAKNATLEIAPIGETESLPPIHIQRSTCLPLSLNITVEDGTEQERAIRDYFTKHGFPTPKEMEIPNVFLPKWPVYSLFTLVCPAEVSKLAQILAELLLVAYGVNEESVLTFRFVVSDEFGRPD